MSIPFIVSFAVKFFVYGGTRLFSILLVQWVDQIFVKNFQIGKVTFTALNVQAQRCCQLPIILDHQ
jgi:hypothetical protein